MTRIITFGEILIRLKSPGYERLFQSSMLEATFGGLSTNVAISLAQFGMETVFVSILPRNDISHACIMELRKFGVDTSFIQFSKGRMGIYFLEAGANQRPSKVTYDRSASSIALAPLKIMDWKEILKNVNWFHISGITPALSSSAAALSLKAVETAKEKGLTVSCDLNYRNQLWKYGKSAKEIMSEIIKSVDICIANEEDIQKSLGINLNHSGRFEDLEINEYQQLAITLMKTYPNIKLAAITLRESKTANCNNWSACMYDGREFYVSTKYIINNIVDRVGGGDSFSSGLIYGLNQYESLEDALEFAVAASCLKHSIIGDFNRTSVDEVESLMAGNISGRLQR